MAAASLKARYGTGKTNGDATGSFSFDAGDLKLRVSAADASYLPNGGVSINSLSIGIEKPGSFIIDYDVPHKDVRFRFMNSLRVSDKPLNLTYSHSVGDNRTSLDGSLVLNSANMVSGSYVFGSGDSKLKYSYVHKGLTTIEPCYDFGKNSLDFAVSQRVYGGDDVVRASYQSSSKVLGMDWLKNSGPNGSVKVSASVKLGEELKFPRITAESTWNIDM